MGAERLAFAAVSARLYGVWLVVFLRTSLLRSRQEPSHFRARCCF